MRKRLILIALAMSGLPRPAQAKFAPGHVPREKLWFSFGARYTRPQKAAISLTLMRALESDTGMVAAPSRRPSPGAAVGS